MPQEQPVYDANGLLIGYTTDGVTMTPVPPDQAQSREYGMRTLDAASQEQLAGVSPDRRFLATATPEQAARYEDGMSLAAPMLLGGGASLAKMGIKGALKALLRTVGGGTAGTIAGAEAGGRLGDVWGAPGTGRETGRKVGGYAGGMVGSIAGMRGWEPIKGDGVPSAIINFFARKPKPPVPVDTVMAGVRSRMTGPPKFRAQAEPGVQHGRPGRDLQIKGSMSPSQKAELVKQATGAPIPELEGGAYVLPAGGYIDPKPAGSAGSAAQATNEMLQFLGKFKDRSALMDLVRRRITPAGAPAPKDYPNFPLPRGK